jgi:molybdopterin-binding protein
MKISARNVLKGKVKAINPGAVTSEIVIEVAPGVEVTASITKKSADDLKLSVGKEAYAVIKSSSVMVGID